MKGHRGNPGLKGRLVNKSIEGYILALETINRLSIHYRVETFCYLICNAWELLLKAKILEDAGKDRDAIFRGKKMRNQRRESISLRESLERVIPNQTDPERRNIECIADLRDADIVLSQASSGGSAVQIVEVPKDPSKSHPHRQVEVLQTLRTALPELSINQHDIQCANKVHGVRQRPEYFYKGTVKGSPGQYSSAYLDWLIQQYRNDREFFVKAKVRAKLKTTGTD
jgi:hypothetical protein